MEKDEEDQWGIPEVWNSLGGKTVSIRVVMKIQKARVLDYQ